MRTIASIALAALVGVLLAVVTTFAIVQRNAPDRVAEAVIKRGEVQETKVVDYGR